MLDDIRPPLGHNKNPNNRRPQRSLRLRGHSLNGARNRLFDDTTPDKGTSVSEQEIQSAFMARPSDPGKPKKTRFAWWRRMSKNKRFAIISFVLLIYGTGALGYFYFTRPEAAPSIHIARSSKPPPPKTIASPLTGVQVAPELAGRPVTGVMIENSRDARPQSGIQDAGVVFEAIAEGGITRFLTLYQEAQPQYVGPVRSLRPYYLDWLVPFDAAIAHVGGSPQALAQVRSGMKDLDQFFNSGSYWRVSSRAAPHNVFTSFERLDSLNRAKGYNISKFTSWPRSDKDKPLATPTAKSVDLNISSALYNVHYAYDSVTNSYLRSIGGNPHIATVSESDKAGQQLHPKVVIALVMSYGTSGKYSVYGTNGHGGAYIFQDGGVAQGAWSKGNRGSQFVFSDSNNVPIKLNAGQTWITIIKDGQLNYTP